MATSKINWEQLILAVIGAAGNGSQALLNTACTSLVLCRNLRGKIHIAGEKKY